MLLKDLTLRITKGTTPNSSSYGKNEVTYIKSESLSYDGIVDESKFATIDFETHNTKLKRSILKENDILYSIAGMNLGKVGIVKSKYLPANTNQAVAIITVNNDLVIPKFLYYYLQQKSVVNFVNSGVSQSAQPNINLAQIGDFDITVPSKTIQEKIVKILDNITNKIILNKDINNNLHELEKNIYKEYFKKLTDDNTKKLGELCNIKYGKGLPTTKIENEGYPVYGGNGIIGYYHDFMYDDSQVLISCRGAASGNVIVSKPQSFVTNNSLVLECDRKYHHYLKQYSLDKYYYEYTTGSAQPQITSDNIKDIVLSIPSDELLESFNKQMDSLELKYFASLEEIVKLEQLRDTLLPKLMNGEIDLDNIEI